MVCPHAVIRPILLTNEEAASAPDTLKALTPNHPKIKNDYKFTLQISGLDCTGCGNCADVCPKDALEMVDFETAIELNQKNCTFTNEIAGKNPVGETAWTTAMINQPRLEYNGASGCCGETR